MRHHRVGGRRPGPDVDGGPGRHPFRRDSWAKQKPKPQNSNQNKPKPQQQRSAISVIQQFGKKYTNFPEEKRLKVKSEIQELAKNVSYDDLEPLFGTALKKVGTRIAVMISLKVLLKNGLKRNDVINEFINKAFPTPDDSHGGT